MTSKEKLGRKILDLIEENEVQLYENEKIVELKIPKIKRNPDQPRVRFDEKRLKDLARSIKRYGVIQPVIVKPSGDHYILISGERRLRALRMIGKNTVPAIVRDYDSLYLAEIAILENLQRENLTVIEEAMAYQRTIKNLEITQKELAEKLGKSRSYITNIIGLLKLPINIINDVNRGLISPGHARVLSKLNDDELALLLAERIKTEKWSVRETEDIARRKRFALMTDNSYVEQLEATVHNKPVFEQWAKDQLGEETEVFFSNNEIKLRFRNRTEFAKALEKVKSYQKT